MSQRPSRASDRGKVDSAASSWGPPHNEPFWATSTIQVMSRKVTSETGGLCSFLAYLPAARNALQATEHAETQKIAIRRPCPGDPLTNGSGHPTAFDDAWGGPFWKGGLAQGFPEARASRFRGPCWGDPDDERFWATRQHSTTRGEAPFHRGGLAQIFRAGHTGRRAIYNAGLQQCRGGPT